MKRITLPLFGMLAVVVACSDVEPSETVTVTNPVYVQPVQDPWVSTSEGTEASISQAVTGVDLTEPIEVVAEAEQAPEALPTGRWFELRRGESLAHFARWSELPVEDVALWSGLDLDGAYAVGTQVFLPVTGAALSEVELSRSAHRELRVDGYLSLRGGSVGNDFYQVRTGDTAWDIAKNSQDIPVWLLEAYNPSIDLERLHPGDELMVPILADVVADAQVMQPEEVGVKTEEDDVE
ncbi:MAG: hypothetical protein ACJAZO_000227 [Myxococcota bacterium]|jgi:hypothetical protein